MDVESTELATEKQKSVLKAFSRSLVREAHVLTQNPELLWQQMYNRLQWEEEPVQALVAKELGQRSLLACRPWFQTRTPFREAEALLRTLSGHNSKVKAVAFSPDGARIVSASWDKTLKLWDAPHGQEPRTLSGHSGWVEAVAFSPDGTKIG